jgi:hypothetical protein
LWRWNCIEIFNQCAPPRGAESKCRVNSGIEAVGPVQWGTHFCQFYETADDLADTLVPFFKAGLDNNERCMWVTAHPLRAHDATDALRNAVPDLDRRLASGQIEIIDHDRWYMTQGGKSGADAVIAGWMGRKDEALAGATPGSASPGTPTSSKPATGTTSPSTRRR